MSLPRAFIRPRRTRSMSILSRSTKALVAERDTRFGEEKEGMSVEQRTHLPTGDLRSENTHNRILVVDDDAPLRGLVVTILSRTGYLVESAGDGVRGWKALRAKKFDLLITDYSMPKLNGLELLRMVRSSPARLPAILMSAAMPQDVGEIIELVSPGGALHKPFSVSQLLYKVGTILDLERSRSGYDAEVAQNGLESAAHRQRETIQHAASTRLNSLACKIWMHESGVESPGDATEPSIFRVCDKLRGPIQTLTGENGFRSILGRALMLSRSEVVWFETVTISSKGFFVGLREAELKLTRTEVICGETVLISHLLGLLFTFIGDLMTRTLLQDVWPECIPMS